MTDAEYAQKRVEFRRLHRDEILALMGDDKSAYWRGPHAEYLQERYRDLIELERL